MYVKLDINQQEYKLIKPLTFMNNSGICIRELIEYFKIESEDVIVFHDDLDIDFGKVKAKFGGSSAGHNGIESIDKFIGKDYLRVRIGIGKDNVKSNITDHVLKDFDEEEKIVVFFVRGDDELEETKAKNAIFAKEIVDANEEEIKEAGLVAGYVGPFGLSSDIMYVVDDDLRGDDELVAGANVEGYHIKGLV